MNIAIIGAGNVGSALAAGFIKAGHAIAFGVRDPQSPKALKAVDVEGAKLLSIEEACRKSEVILISTPPDIVVSLVPQLGDVKNKIIIDTTNSVRTRPEPYATAYHAIKALTGSEKIVKCFNTTGFENMAQPIYPPFGGIDMFCAGNDQESKSIAQKLAKEMGFAEC